jgi:DHA1 family bicyclomycin/chloramphenicol resistance-like MFS transporter
MTAVTPPAARRRDRSEVFTILVLGMLTAFAPMAIDMYLPALPAIGTELHAGQAEVQLSLSAFLLCFGLSQLFWGPLSDRAGRKRPAALGILIYLAGSAGCALAGSTLQLTLWRAVQALGSGAAPALARAMVRDRYDGSRVAAVLSVMMMVMGLAPLLAPILGGQVLAWGGWRAIFWALVGFGGLALAGLLALPESLPPERRRPGSWAALLRGYDTLLGERAFLGNALAGGFMYAGMFAYISGTPFVYIQIFHVDPSRYGFLFGLNVVGMMAAAAVNSRLVGRLGPRRLLRLGIAAGAAGATALLVAAATGALGLAGIVLPLLLFVGALGLVGANAMAGALAGAPHLAGTASALLGSLQFGLGAVAGGAVAGLADGTPVPMAATIFALALLALAADRLLVRPAAEQGA